MEMTKHAFTLFHILSVVTFGIILSFASFKIFHIIYQEQGSPYVDEIFHIPQAKLYCKNQWTKWNPKITTLPGLYIVSYFFLKPIEQFESENFCSVYNLRFTNIIATISNFLLVFKISCYLEEKYREKSNFLFKLLTAFNISIFPPLYFFTFLYYTDVWSTTFVLLVYYLHLQNTRIHKILGVFAGFMAVLMRQTNIIWIGLMILDDIWNILSGNFKPVSVQDYTYSKKVWVKFFSDLFRFKKNIKYFFTLLYNILTKAFHNIVICVLFIIFVIFNKSIVVGDKEAHIATFHPMQNLYFLDFLAFFGWPFFIFEILSSWKKPVNIFLIMFLIGLCAGLSEINKLEHPYLLADNRHIAFYLWKRIFGHSIFRRMVIPSYVGAAILLFRILQKRCHFMFMVIVLLCTFLNVTPQYLFELRYFILPFIIHRLQFKQSSAVVLESVFFIAINAGVINLFLNHPFVWTSEPNVKQRFIW